MPEVKTYFKISAAFQQMTDQVRDLGIIDPQLHASLLAGIDPSGKQFFTVSKEDYAAAVQSEMSFFQSRKGKLTDNDAELLGDWQAQVALGVMESEKRQDQAEKS